MIEFKATLITGATSGIGLELSKLFAKNGSNLVLVARDKERLDSLAQDLRKQSSIKVLTIQKDLSLTSAALDVFKKIGEEKIHIDILVNNAGFNEYGLFSKTRLNKELQMIQLNVASLTYLTKLVIPEMLKRKQGKILNVGSIGSFVPGPFNAVYCATKAYILSFSEAIAEELKDTGITVTTLCPGATETEFAKRAGIEDIRVFKNSFMRMKSPKVAQIGYNALHQGKSVVVSGLLNKINVLSFKFMPRKLATKIIRFFMDRPQNADCCLKGLLGIKNSTP